MKFKSLFPVFVSVLILFCNVAFSTTYYVKPAGSDSNDGLSWSQSFSSMTKAMDVVTSGDAVWAAAGTYTEGAQITIPVNVSVYGGFNGSETQLSQRDIQNNKTIIDGENSYRCVYNNGTFDGFFVTNGYTTTDGAGINSEGIIANCTVYGNTAGDDGGGIMNWEGTVVNCVLYNNTATGGETSFGGGICNYSGTVANCTLYNNYHTGNYELGGGIFTFGSSAMVFNCISWNNNHGDIVGLSNEIYNSCYGNASGTGNISANPLFVNTSGDASTWDFRLQDGSPCVDAGRLNNAPAEDIEGNERPGGDNLICMGAYESPSGYVTGAPFSQKLYVSPSGDNSDGQSWATAFTSLQSATTGTLVNDSDDLFVVWVAAGTYLEGQTVLINSRCQLYGGFDGTETSIDQRDISNNQTIIDGENNHRCVINYGRLDGFYITGGNTPEDGGGVFNEYGTVTNCTVYANQAARHGGGIKNSVGTVTHCEVFSNSSSGSFGAGGGINSHHGVVSHCTVYNNSITANECKGGGVSNVGGLFENCVIYGNTASALDYDKCRGGGVYNDAGEMINCTVYDNVASGTGTPKGGGIYGTSGSNVVNCIAWNNTNEDIWCWYASPGEVNFSCFETAQNITGSNNISQNPLFKNAAAADFRLQLNSPCIDSGTSVNAPETDMDETGRPQDGDLDGSYDFDRGAYEFHAVFLEITSPSLDVIIPDTLTSYDFSGAAFSTTGTISLVEYRVNSGAWQNAAGTENWSFMASGLNQASNLVEVRAQDGEWDYSEIQSRTITRKKQYTLTYLADENGFISGDSTQLVYHGDNGAAVEAVPNPGYHFDQWSDHSTENPRTDGNVTSDISVTANFHDITPPVSFLVPDDTTVTSTSLQLPFTAMDEGSGVDYTKLWVMPPGSGSFTQTGLTETGSSGVFHYTASDGKGVYEFATSATDNASNQESDPTTSTATIIVNTVENSPFTWTITSGDEVTTFPMTNDIDILISITGAEPGGKITVSRITGDAAPANYNPATLINEYLIITGEGLGTEWTATITWNYDPDSEAGLVGNVNSVFQFEGDTIIRIITVNPSGKTIVIPGVTSFSEWYAGDDSSKVIDWKRF